MSDIPVWKMVKQVISTIDHEITNQEIKQRILSIYPGTNLTSINCAIISGSVNANSRIHYGENRRPRIANTERDFMFKVGEGRVVPYNPANSTKYGIWEIYEKDDGSRGVRIVDDATSDIDSSVIESISSEEVSSKFALESHLRDYLARNLESLSNFDGKLSLYVHSDNRDGVEFLTDVGSIDVLAISNKNELYVFELKLGRGADATLGQILRYMGWITEHLANGRKVHGVIVAEDICKKLKYAATLVKQVQLMEYSLKFDVKTVAL